MVISLWVVDARERGVCHYIYLNSSVFIGLTHRRRLDDVADDEFLDGFVLGRTPGAIGAPHRLHVTTPLLRPTVVSPLLRHFNLIIEIS